MNGAVLIMDKLMTDGYEMYVKKQPVWPHPWRCEQHLHRPSDCGKTCDWRQYDGFDQVMARLRAKYGAPIGEGRHRITFKSKHVVVKMPKHMIAIHASQTEFDRFKRNDPSESGRLARCRMIQMHGVPLIVMERLETNIDYRTKPTWSWDYDAGQIGFDRKGNMKAYDYTTF